MNLEMAGRKCVIVGGGAVAERKARSLLAAEGAVTIIAPELNEGLKDLALSSSLDWYQMSFFRGMISEIRPQLVFCATDNAEVNAQAAEEAREIGALVNAAAEPEGTDFTVPASFRRGELLVTVSTGGASPGLARALREELEQEFPESFGAWLERMTALRQELKDSLSGSEARQAFWRRALSKNVLALVRDGKILQAEAEIRNAIDDAGTKSQDSAG